MSKAVVKIVINFINSFNSPIKMPGSVAAYAPGMFTVVGVAVPDPPTLSWKQDM